MSIIVAGVDLFDYSDGEPAPQYLTVLRALEVYTRPHHPGPSSLLTAVLPQISDPYVLRVLINAARIERNLLAHTRAEGDNLVREVGGGTCLTADLYRVTLSYVPQ